jgi:phytoene synthase
MTQRPDLNDPERQLAVGHTARLAQPSLATLFAIDERLGGIVARTRETTIGLMRLVWWREALTALDHAAPPAEPLLAAAAALRPDGVSGAEIAAMVEGWEALIDDPELGAETLALHAEERGGRLFALAGRVIGVEAPRIHAAGQGWALADLARHVSDPAQADRVLAVARPILEKAVPGRWPRALRPLGMLAVLAREDTRRGAAALRPPVSRGRLLRVMLHQMSGR